MELEDKRHEMDVDEKIARLEAAARERWGDKWTIDVQYFADGTTSASAFSIVVPGSDVKTKERLSFLWNGELHWERVRVCEDRHVEVLDHDEIPEEIAEYGGIIDDTDEDRTLVLDEDGSIRVEE